MAVVAGDLAAGRPGRRTAQRLPVRTQDAFAAAGGAGGEEDVGEVVGTHGGGAGIGGRLVLRVGAATDELVPRAVVETRTAFYGRAT